MTVLRPLLIAAGLITLWQGIIVITGVQFFILPSPARVALALVERYEVIAGHAVITLSEILLGLLLGSILGTASALIMGYFRSARLWLMPVLVISQAVPVFALAPILVLWLGYGLGSKVAMIGEWVGSSQGLGYLMLHANGRMQIDVMFAALFVLAVIAITLYFLIDAVMRRLIRWQPETKPSND